ncbi:hypothetical protein GCM10027168_28040 [Streptomyces capparidis]
MPDTEHETEHEAGAALDALLARMRGLPAAPPRDPEELAELLNRLKAAAARWADLLYEVHRSARHLAGPRAAAATEIAFRRAEESYTELEIAHRDLAGGGGPG